MAEPQLGPGAAGGRGIRAEQTEDCRPFLWADQVAVQDRVGQGFAHSGALAALEPAESAGVDLEAMVAKLVRDLSEREVGAVAELCEALANFAEGQRAWGADPVRHVRQCGGCRCHSTTDPSDKLLTPVAKGAVRGAS
ncbi:hypothetical protein GCM10020000_85670 [Streptomyces olivoverticillatus]